MANVYVYHDVNAAFTVAANALSNADVDVRILIESIRVPYLMEKELKLETKAMTTSSQCNTGRICVTLPIITTETRT